MTGLPQAAVRENNKSKKQYNCTEINPWRYPGFLNERFVPFFFYANGLRKIEVPLAFLE